MDAAANSREEKCLPPKAYFTVEQTKKPADRRGEMLRHEVLVCLPPSTVTSRSGPGLPAPLHMP